MNTSDPKRAQNAITKRYSTPIQALGDLAELYYRLGRLEDASRLSVHSCRKKIQN